MDRLEEIKARIDAATPGPWWNETHVIHAPLPNSGACHPLSAPLSNKRHFEDCEFAAHARQDVPWLIAQVERLQTEIRDLVNCARQYMPAGFPVLSPVFDSSTKIMTALMERLKTDAVAAEREACAQVAEDWLNAVRIESMDDCCPTAGGIKIEDTIRARGTDES